MCVCVYLQLIAVLFELGFNCFVYHLCTKSQIELAFGELISALLNWQGLWQFNWKIVPINKHGKQCVGWLVAWMCRLVDKMQSHSSRSQSKLARLRDPHISLDSTRRSNIVQLIKFNRSQCPWHEGLQPQATNGTSMFQSIFDQFRHIYFDPKRFQFQLMEKRIIWWHAHIHFF